MHRRAECVESGLAAQLGAALGIRQGIAGWIIVETVVEEFPVRRIGFNDRWVDIEGSDVEGPLEG
jgi:hypothetical protein